MDTPNPTLSSSDKLGHSGEGDNDSVDVAHSKSALVDRT